MFDTWGWRMAVNFSYVFAAILVTLILAKAMGSYEKSIIQKDVKLGHRSLGVMAVCSLGVGYAVSALFATFIHFPHFFINALIILSMGGIIFTSSKRYIEKICREGTLTKR